MTGNSSTPVLFVGGPWDGKRMIVPTAPMSYRVACAPQLASPYPCGEAIATAYESYEYDRVCMSEDRCFFVIGPERWHRNRETPVARLIRLLADGYRNFER